MFDYHCPECQSTNRLHLPDCDFAETGRDYEQAYVDIISTLSLVVCSRESLKEEAYEWSELHDAVLERLCSLGRVHETHDGSLQLVHPDRLQHQREPHFEPLATIYTEGTVRGSHDNGIFALIAYYSHIGLSWEETKKEMLEWFNRTGTWNRGGFAEGSPEAVLEKKHHVWDRGYGWERKGSAAKRVIEKVGRQSAQRGIAE